MKIKPSYSILFLFLVGCTFYSPCLASETQFQHDSLQPKLTDSEKRLDDHLKRLRSDFLAKIEKDSVNLFGSSFHEIKPLIEGDSVYRIFQKMPKGGLLHTHSDGISNIDWLIKTARTYPECFVFTQHGNKEYLYGQLAVFKPGTEPTGFVKLGNKIQSDPTFHKELHSLLTLTRPSIAGYMDYWGEFEKRFERIGLLTQYRPFFKEYYKRALQEMVNDNVQHLEIRFIINRLYDSNGKEFTIETTINDLLEILKEVQKTDPEFTLKLIYTSLKFLDKETIKSEVRKAFELKKTYPDFIKGFDLVAEEDGNFSTAYYQECWELMEQLEQDYGFELPLYMHAGESNSRENKNIEGTPLEKNKRIGHGLNLVLFPEQVEKVHATNNLIEVNPISNQILGYVNDIRNHPGRQLLEQGIPLAISNDDPGVFAYEGLAYDFWMVYIAWELDLLDIKKLVFNSIEYSALSVQEKEESLKELNGRWAFFVENAL